MKVSSNPGEQAQPADSISGYHPPAGDLLPPQQTGQPAGADIRVVTKFLITNAAAGSVIGKNGTNIQHCQNQTGARMQLSRTGELFPGTNDRIILLAGTSRQVQQQQLYLSEICSGSSINKQATEACVLDTGQLGAATHAGQPQHGRTQTFRISDHQRWQRPAVAAISASRALRGYHRQRWSHHPWFWSGIPDEHHRVKLRQATTRCSGQDSSDHRAV